MKALQKMRTAAAYLKHGGILSPLQTAMFFPPSDRFVTHLSDLIGNGTQTILNLGCAAGLLEMKLLERDMIGDLCVSVDLNDDFLRTMKRHLAELDVPEERKRRVHAVHDRAQNVEKIIGEHFGEKKIDWVLISFSVRIVGWETTRTILQALAPHMSGRGGTILYNYFSTLDLMQSCFSEVATQKMNAWWRFPRFDLEINIGRHPRVGTSMTVA